MNHQRPTREGQWSECQPGEVAGMVRRLRRNRSLKRLQVAIGAATCLFAFLFVGSVFLDRYLSPPVELTHA